MVWDHFHICGVHITGNEFVKKLKVDIFTNAPATPHRGRNSSKGSQENLIIPLDCVSSKIYCPQ